MFKFRRDEDKRLSEVKLKEELDAENVRWSLAWGKASRVLSDISYKNIPVLNSENVDRCAYCKMPIWEESRLCSQCGAPLPRKSGIIAMRDSLDHPYSVWSHR